MKNTTRNILDNAIFETLEDRRMMSVTPLGSVSLSNGVLTIQGDDGQPTNMTVDYAPNGGITGHAGQTWKTFDPTKVKELVINGGGGDDYIYINPNIDLPGKIQTGDGNVTVRAGGGNDTITAGSGDDSIHVVRGDNIINGGSGNDTLIAGKGDHDTITAGSGVDSISGGLAYGSILGVRKGDTVTESEHDTITYSTQPTNPTSGTGAGGSGGTTTGTGRRNRNRRWNGKRRRND